MLSVQLVMVRLRRQLPVHIILCPALCPGLLFLSINSSILSSPISINTYSGNSFIHHSNVLHVLLFCSSSTASSHQLSVFFETQQFYRNAKYCCHAVLKQHKPKVTLFWLSQTDLFLPALIHLVLSACISQQGGGF